MTPHGLSTIVPRDLQPELARTIQSLPAGAQMAADGEVAAGALSAADALALINTRKYNLLSIDVENYEWKQEHLLEIGLSIYKPSYQTHALFPHIVNFHIILEEGLKYANKRFVPNNRLNNITGQSIIANKVQAQTIMQKVFDDVDLSKTIVVGHGFASDMRLFRMWGLEFPQHVKVADTMKLWSSLVPSAKKSSLCYILDKLGIPYAYLHNAVNDSYYTLVACLMLASPEIRNNLVIKEKEIDDETGEEVVVHRVRCSPHDQDLELRGPDRKSKRRTQQMYFHAPRESFPVEHVESVLKEFP
ncbi:hypothetical protein KL930_003837 [Ogataea haglerorum]|uniref:Gfd2/YDR514C-like C-terminal domain-containing protein n=1 Tax=Ogataea haglerorum TaxID=1937702 RepID=A0AAN6D429_9ASCO|nr:uncharacterized protein KL911_003977 [Ogataea haglerorum]KAG7694519.1 hypothetical protein KL915_003486 [Ogataea haglerorum]KAG7705146.1 hypothetical protein KL914_003832 [Ogataea haglerorum]KAG7705402.1 hypothetical protein KL950_003838 [Ogataea haglerorum]KAG7716728.1 hypothetical protein KL913_003244 [Ogataea haglerorum]KAG7717519.1 hypothetical protein KL949_003353 [Ogataea haglerorum]